MLVICVVQSSSYISSCIDECMAKLFADGSIVNKSIEWMSDDNKDLSLKTTAALIIANMARNGV